MERKRAIDHVLPGHGEHYHVCKVTRPIFRNLASVTTREVGTLEVMERGAVDGRGCERECRNLIVEGFRVVAW
jgi:hypothetical protein